MRQATTQAPSFSPVHSPGWMWILLALLVVSNPLALARDATNNPVIVVGVLTDNYPHSFMDSDHVPAGYAVELLAAVERTMGLKLKRVVGDTKEINTAFYEGRLDMLQSLAESPEREKFADFSVPYLTMTGCIFTRKNTTGIHALEDLRGRKVMVHPGSLGEQLLISSGLSNCIVRVSSVEEAFERLSHGEADATLASKITGGMLVANKRMGNIITVGDPIPGFQVRYCFAVREGNKKLLAKLNEGLALIERTGEAERIYRRWFERVDPHGYSALQFALAAVGGLVLALCVAVWGIVRQAKLRRRIAHQAGQLRVSEEEYRGIFELSLYGLIVVNAKNSSFDLERINAAALRLLGASTPPPRGAALEQFFPQESGLWEKIKSRLAPPVPGEFEHPRPDRPGAAWLRVALSQSDSRVQIALTDITAAKHAEEKLRQQENHLRQSQKLEAIGTLSSGIAHDFNNILTSVLGNCELIRLDLKPDDPMIESINEINQAAERARQLVRQILSFSRQGESKREVIDISPVTRECVRFLRATTPSSIEIRHESKARASFIEADPTQIHQVVMNLGTNAVQAMRNQPGLLEIIEERIEITAELATQNPQLKEGDYLRVTVRDTGCGMTPEIMQRIFEPFFTTKAPGEGTGLGLSVVHGIVSSHKGAVTVYSEPGKGTVFHLYFPITKLNQKTSDTEDRKLFRGQGERILVVEDEESIRRMAEQALYKLGYQVSSFSDPLLALAEFTQNSRAYHVVFTDLTMPHSTGLELIAQVRALRPEMPVMLASGFFTQPDLARAQALKVNRILEKPLDISKISEAVATCLKRA